jgi:hypothetical protein
MHEAFRFKGHHSNSRGSKRFKARKKKVRATSHGGEGRQCGDFLAGQHDVLNNVELEHDISDQT